MLRKGKNIAPLVVVVCLLMACHRDNNHPGYVYLPDMDESQAYDTYSDNPVFKDGKTMQPPVEGTISRGDIPYPYHKNDEDLALAGKNIKNPFRYNNEVKKEGEKLYARFCLHCHGQYGDGKGHLYTSGKYPYPPANLLQEKTLNRTDGEIYHVVTVGLGIMGPHGAQIRPEDRWKIIMYLKNELQGKEDK